MTDQRCPVTELRVPECAHCRERGRRTVLADDRPRAVAAYHGHCPGCDQPIEPGAALVLDDERWTHEGCPP